MSHPVSSCAAVSRSIRIAMLVVPASLLVAVVFGQYMVNRQLNVGGGPPSVRYASSPYAQRVNQSASAMLPSQQRYAVMRSGALPSEMRMNYNAVGPLAPTGAVAYLPPSPAGYVPQRSVTSGNMVNPQAIRPSTAMPGMATPNAGSVRYTPGPIRPSTLTPASSLGVAQKGVPAGQVPYGQTPTGSVRYGQ